MTFKYLTFDEVIELHKNLIDEFGGTHGIRDINLLEAAIMRPQTGYYETLYEQAAALMESLANNHPFIDGNKRVAFFVTDAFLRNNGYFIKCDGEEAYAYFMELFEANTFCFLKLLDWLNTKVQPIDNLISQLFEF
jgi:death-on-curing protein